MRRRGVALILDWPVVRFPSRGPAEEAVPRASRATRGIAVSAGRNGDAAGYAGQDVARWSIP